MRRPVDDQIALQAGSRPRLGIRIDLGDDAWIGPGKVALLEEIERTGSISAAGRGLSMSYRLAWELVVGYSGQYS